MMTVYHTSLSEFEKFDRSFIGSSTGWRGVVAGFFFSVKRGHNSHIADGQEGWIEYVCELDVKNPANAATYEESAEKWGEEDEAVKNLEAAGHDAMILGNGDEVIVWDESKIKIIGKKAL